MAAGKKKAASKPRVKKFHLVTTQECDIALEKIAASGINTQMFVNNAIVAAASDPQIDQAIAILTGKKPASSDSE